MLRLVPLKEIVVRRIQECGQMPIDLEREPLKLAERIEQ